ncbi:MAG TPA: hypothetical protein VHW66_11175 [Stellaceae bacterium]|nr:hypothetical protein [Stellaceae bacterium]
MPDDVPRGGGAGRRGSDLETRVAVLEAAVTEVRTELKAIREDLANLKNVPIELAEIKGKISNLPTNFQLVFVLATFALTSFLGATGLSLAIIRFGH